MIANLEPPIHHSRRLIVRALRAHDAAAVALHAGDIDVARMTTSIPHPLTRDDAEGFVGRMVAADPARERVLALEHPDEGLAGLIGLHPAADGGVEIGYWLGKPFWGQGLMTEALAATLAWTRTSWNRRVLFAGHFADNLASGRVLIKAGFLYTGVVKPRFCLARNAEVATRMMVWLA